MSYLNDWKPRLRLTSSRKLYQSVQIIGLLGCLLISYVSLYQPWMLFCFPFWFWHLRYTVKNKISLNHFDSVNTLYLEKNLWYLIQNNEEQLPVYLQNAFVGKSFVFMKFKQPHAKKAGYLTRVLSLSYHKQVTLLIFDDQLSKKQSSWLRTGLRYRREDFFCEV